MPTPLPWREFVSLYRPLLIRYIRSWNLSAAESEDIAQKCLTEVSRKMPDFQYDKSKGGFKRWLRVLTTYRVKSHFRKRREQEADSGTFKRAQERELTPVEAWERVWKLEHLHYCLKQVREKVEEKTFEAFKYVHLDGWPVQRVCETLNMNPAQVYNAKSRVTRHLKEKMVAILGDEG